MTGAHRHRFLDVLAQTGSRTMAAGVAGVTVAEITEYRRVHPNFEREWREAEARARKTVRVRTTASPW